MNEKTPLLEVTDLKMHFPIKGGLLKKTVGHVYAVDGVSFKLEEGETLGLVGESGCGKSTLGRTIMRLYNPTGGKIVFNGKDITRTGVKDLLPVRREMAMVFQDPYASLNPRKTVASIISTPLAAHGVGTQAERNEKVQELLKTVGMRPSAANRYPHEFSGGQRQRIGIARALILNPKLVIADEPVSALDVSIQAQVINLLQDLKKTFGLTYIFIAHDLAVVELISTSVAVMYLGHIMEKTSSKALYRDPQHPYTQALLAAIPVPDPTKRKTHVPLQGDIPSPIEPPAGCVFHTRCPVAEARCKTDVPALKNLGSADDEHWVACHLRG